MDATGATERDDQIKQLPILIVDDQKANVRLLERLLVREGYAHVEGITDPSQAREACVRIGPQLVLLDLHMPDVDGFEVMSALREAGLIRELAILILTGDVSVESRRRALSFGASDFVLKPLDPVEILLRVHNVLENRWLKMEIEAQNASLKQRIAERSEEPERTHRELLDRLALVAEFHDYPNSPHTRRVREAVGMIAQQLDLSDETVAIYRDAAALHDIGKVGVPTPVLLKPGPLGREELQMMRDHALIGARILGGGESPVLRLAEQIALTHHERWDGTGYPSGLAAEQIPLAGRITAIADVFDALTHDRPYRSAIALDDALEKMHELAKGKFDPALAEIFLGLDLDKLR